jgi:cytoskeletal protein CcmA (bactofilin family)
VCCHTDVPHTDRVLIDERRDHHEVSMGRWRHPRNRRGQEEPEEDERSERPPAAPDDLPPEVGSGVAEAPGMRTVEDRKAVVEEVRMNEARDRADVSVVGAGTRIEGTVVATGSLRVDGEVKGKITAEKEVSLSPRGRVEADIQADSITLAGQVKGDLNAKTDVSLPAESRLLGDIRAHNVEVGGAVKGMILARGTVRLGPRARVEGDITSTTLAIAEGAVFVGTSFMGQEAAHQDQHKREMEARPA